jgi:hypothetical protein
MTGPGRLLPADDELGFRRRGRGLAVRAVHVHLRGRLLEPGERDERAEPVELRLEDRPRHLELRLVRATSANVRRSPVSSAYSSVIGSSPAGSTKRDVASFANS